MEVLYWILGGIAYATIGFGFAGYIHNRNESDWVYPDVVLGGIFWPITLFIILFLTQMGWISRARHIGMFLGTKSLEREKARVAARVRIAREQEKQRIELKEIEAEVMRELEVDGASLRNEHKVI